jgi:hypothetical protein
MNKFYVILGVALVLATQALASGSTDRAASNPIMIPGEEQSFRPTVVLQCKIVEVFEQYRRLMVEDVRTGERHYLHVADEVGIKAKSKKDFEGRKKLRFGDFVVGQTLNVTLEADSYRPLKIRVLDPGLA